MPARKNETKTETSEMLNGHSQTEELINSDSQEANRRSIMTTKKESEMLNGHSQTGELINSDSQEAKGSKMAEINPEEAPRETGETILADYAGSNGFNRLDMIPMDNLIHLCRLTMEQLNNEMENQISKQ